MKAPLPPREAERLVALRAFRVLDTPPERAFDDLTHVAAHVFGTPVSLVTLVDAERQWFKSNHGIEVRETHRDLSFCAHAILRPDEVLVVEDATKDPWFADNPHVTGPPGWRFYAGAPIVTPRGNALGTICVLDRVARKATEAQRSVLAALARRARTELEMRRALGEIEGVLGHERPATVARPSAAGRAAPQGWGSGAAKVTLAPLAPPTAGAVSERAIEGRVVEIARRLRRLQAAADAVES